MVGTPAKKGEAAIALRLAGATYEEITEALSYSSVQVCRNDIQRALAEGVNDHDRAKHRELATLRYERLLRGLWGKAINPESPEQLPAARAAREIIDRIIAVQGAAQPTEVVVHSPTTAAIMDWVAKVTAVGAPQVEEADPFADAVDAELVPELPQEAHSTHEGQG